MTSLGGLKLAEGAGLEWFRTLLLGGEVGNGVDMAVLKSKRLMAVW